MKTEEKTDRFTVYLEGHEGHQGNVLAHTYVKRISRLINVFGSMERVYEGSNSRKTDFEIIAADKRNPTTLTLKPVPKVKNYIPFSAMEWGLTQLEIIESGEEPDNRIRSGLLRDIAEMSAESTDMGHKKFWINGHTNPINFNESFQAKALNWALKRELEDTPKAWHEGKSMGEIIGRLEKVDDYSADNEVIIVLPTVPEGVKCTFPDSMKTTIGAFLFKTVKISGLLHYRKTSPHPFKVDIKENGVEIYRTYNEPTSIRSLEGIFKGKVRKETDWGELLIG